MRKRFVLLFLVCALVLCAGTGVWAIIQGTPHDVNVMRETTGLEPCAMCHTPHTQETTVQYPLWNRKQTSQTYQPYASPTFDMKPDTFTLREPSTLCMACHNGMDSTLVNYPGPGSIRDSNYDFGSSLLKSGQSNLGTDLRGEHPVSFDYEPSKDTATDNNGFPEAVTLSTGSVTRKYILGTSGNYPLYGSDNKGFECATCHAVHHTAEYDGPAMVNGRSAGTQVYFLRSDNRNSQMCTDCHTKR